MRDEPGESRSRDRTWTAGSPTRRDAAPYCPAGWGRSGLPRGAWTTFALCVLIFTGTESYAEVERHTVRSAAGQVSTPDEQSGVGLPPGCKIRIERWEDSCIEETTGPHGDDLDRLEEVVVDFDQFSLARRQRDKDHLVYRSSEAFGPQFSLVVVEPRTRAFNLGLHLRFEYAF